MVSSRVKRFLAHFELFVAAGMLFSANAALGQKQASSFPPSAVYEEVISMLTYPYSDPNPVANIKSFGNVYPNFKYEKYSDEGIMKDWNFVILENQFIKVYILPAEGGKIWGAIEKSTGYEYIYKNEVLKYRNLAQRGPWTSGGMEFNFGIIGHAPTTSSPVDYKLEEHDDGSVSCTVGSMDISSRTPWRVRITLPADRAWFETHTSWYNGTELEQAYYHWMNCSAVVSEDLQYFYPGHLFLEHSGELKNYPFDEEGRDLSRYSENAFGFNKSYHIVGSAQDFFGGYYHQREFGFGHWSHHEAMPGKKLWMWTQSREGGIWEDLLTDTDGQYMEWQAGRMFNQFEPQGYPTPLTKPGFGTHTYDHWKEIWFPFKGIGGMLDASPFGVLNVEESSDGVLSIGINALAPIEEEVVVLQGGKEILRKSISMNPMEVEKLSISLDKNEKEREVIIGDQLLYYSSDREKFLIKRPFEKEGIESSPWQKLEMEATAAYRTRDYELALAKYRELEEIDSLRFEVLAGLAKCYYRMSEFDKALNYANLILKQDTYDAEGNYLAGIIYKAKGDRLNARECFGWAARNMKYRTSAYSQIGEILLAEGRLQSAEDYLENSIDFNRFNLNSLCAKALIYRIKDEQAKAEQVILEILQMDPLCHFALHEKALWSGTKEAMTAFLQGVRNEYREESFVELALQYQRLGRTKEALELLEKVRGYVMAELWSAYLLRDSDPVQSQALLQKALEQSPAFIFPFRLESLSVLQWAEEENSSWKTRYYLGLNYLALNNRQKAKLQFEACGMEPDFAPFYLCRADQFYMGNQEAQMADLLMARTLAPGDWRVLYRLTEQYLSTGQLELAREVSAVAMKKHPDQFRVSLQHIKLQLQLGEYESCLKDLQEIIVLPAENAYESRRISEQAHLLLALQHISEKDFKAALETLERSMLWPENLGVGKPYDYDSRRQDLLKAYCLKQMGKKSQYKKMLEGVASDQFEGALDDVLSIIALRELGFNDEALKWTSDLQNRKQTKWMNEVLEGKSPIAPEGTRWDRTLQYQIILEIANLYL